MRIPIEYVQFPAREVRSRFVAERFRPWLKDSLLDVGCYEAPLREILQDVKYTGIDIVGRPDITLNLETCERLPFEDNSFECVTCIDVLEHLDNLHRIFDELIRVTRNSVIVSLPNCWRDARRPIERGKGVFAHYSLPLERPVDRHKWFFNASQIHEFYRKQAERLGVEIVDLFATQKRAGTLVDIARRVMYPGGRYHNRYSQTLWVVYRKTRTGRQASRAA
jgi:2-polyprenyl-3-methyl-5-hydroxy-6-metoxy-1,4-benzoquinol methylase